MTIQVECVGSTHNNLLSDDHMTRWAVSDRQQNVRFASGKCLA